MSNNQRRHQFKSRLSLVLVPLMVVTTTSLATNRVSALTNLTNLGEKPQIIAQNFTGFIASFWQRRPRKRNIARSGFCAIAPGVVETYFVWHNQPMFLWNRPEKSETAQLIVRDYDTQKTVWKQNVDTMSQKIAYGGAQPLEAGKLYQWQLEGKNNWVTFKIMPTSQRQKIATDLQALEQKLKASRTSPEEIALKKADYFLNYKISHRTETGVFHPWSDALQVLNEVQNPNADFIKQRDEFVASVCSPSPATARQVD